jgi:hypothetical protein
MARKTASFAQFFYRVNPDSTIESICGFCFDASAAMLDRAKLQLWEANHHCAEKGEGSPINYTSGLQSIGKLAPGREAALSLRYTIGKLLDWST